MKMKYSMLNRLWFSIFSDKLLSSAIQPFVKRRIGDNKIKSTVYDIMRVWEVTDVMKRMQLIVYQFLPK